MIKNTVVKKTMLLLDLFKLKITLINIIAISVQFEKTSRLYLDKRTIKKLAISEDINIKQSRKKL